jgi:DNA adenine methylase
MAKKIMPLIPPGHPYVEPFAGAASLFWHMDPPRKVEALNDLHSEIINLFRVLQDREQYEALAHRLTWTPYSLDEFRLALETEGNGSEVDRAWSFFVRQNQGFAGVAKTEGDWGKAISSSWRGMSATSTRWRTRLGLLHKWHDRLSRVQLDNRDALTCIRYWDTPETVFYIDPPYVADTRAAGSKAAYKHEYSDQDHRQLVDLLLACTGKVVLSGYDSELYQPLIADGWDAHRIKTSCYAAGRTRNSGLQGKGAATAKVPRVEVVYRNPQCVT